MLIRLNGQPVAVAAAATVSQLVRELGLDPAAVVVERNRVILPRQEWARTPLAADDNLEILRFVGGG